MNSFRSLASKGFHSGYSKSVCVRLHSENSEPTMLFYQTTPDEDPPTPPPCRWQALITLPTLAKLQLVWRRLCDAVLFLSSCIVEHTLTAVCVIPEYQPGRKYNVHIVFFLPSKYRLYFRPDWYREVRLELYGANARASSLVLLPSLPLTRRRHHQADGQLSSLYRPSPSFSSIGAACVKLCCLPPPLFVRSTRFCCLVNV